MTLFGSGEELDNNIFSRAASFLEIFSPVGRFISPVGQDAFSDQYTGLAKLSSIVFSVMNMQNITLKNQVHCKALMTISNSDHAINQLD